MNAGLMKHQVDFEPQSQSHSGNKWDILRDLSVARKAFGLSDRDITVLQALISFHPETVLENKNKECVVYPSNNKICERLFGMPCSTMRRHVGNLVNAGIVRRRDSPNGKRYARYYNGEKIAYGFDLTPMLLRRSEFRDAALEELEAAERLKVKRETVVLMRRDLAGLAHYGSSVIPKPEVWTKFIQTTNEVAKRLRRKLTMADLDALADELQTQIDSARDKIKNEQADKMSTNDAPIEHHCHNSKTESFDIERARHTNACSSTPRASSVKNTEELQMKAQECPNDVTLDAILSNCSEIQSYIDGEISDWHDLTKAAESVRPMMGISSAVWALAKKHMGQIEASVVVAAMLERFQRIRSPGAYLRTLAVKASEGRFRCMPMVLALG